MDRDTARDRLHAAMCSKMHGTGQQCGYYADDPLAIQRWAYSLDCLHRSCERLNIPMEKALALLEEIKVW